MIPEPAAVALAVGGGTLVETQCLLRGMHGVTDEGAAVGSETGTLYLVHQKKRIEVTRVVEAFDMVPLDGPAL